MTIISLQIEQHTDEQTFPGAITEELSDFDTKSVAEATESKKSVPLSLVDDIIEIIVQASVPEEVTLYVILEHERGIEGKHVADITTHG